MYKKTSKTLIIIDMQNDFITGSLANENALKIIPYMCEYIKHFKGNIILTKDTHDKDYLYKTEGRFLPVKHCIKGTWGHEITNEFTPYLKNHALKYGIESIQVIEKETFGYLKWNIKTDEIILMGTCTDICVISNALILRAKYPEKKISVISNLCAGSTEETHKEALDIMQVNNIELVQYLIL